MAIGDVLRLAVVSKDNTGQNSIVNVFHFRQSAVLILDTPFEDLAQAWLDQVLGVYKACMTASYEVVQLQPRSLEVPASGIDVPVTGGTGTLSGSQNLPHQIAPIITWRTPFVGRRFRGRSYMPVITEDHQNDGVIDSTLTGLLEDFADAMLGMAAETISSAGWELVIHSVAGSADTPVTAYAVRPLLGTQRKRRTGAGS